MKEEGEERKHGRLTWRRDKFPPTIDSKREKRRRSFSSSSFAREDVSRSKRNNWVSIKDIRRLTKTREEGRTREMRFERKKGKVDEGGQLALESIGMDGGGWWSNLKNLNGRWRLATFGLRARYEHGPMRTERKGIGSYARPRGTGTYGRHFWSFR